MALPQPLLIAAATALVKLKPVHLTIPEYIHALRQSIRTCRQGDRVYREHDHAKFWQNQHDFLHSALERERDTAFVLKQQNESLETQVTELQARLQSGNRKRKPAVSKEPDVARQAKTDSVVIAEFGPAAETEHATRAMRHIHQVLTLCKGQMYSTEANALAHHLVQATEALTSVVESLSTKSSRLESNPDQTIVAIARSCISIFHGLKRLQVLAGSDRFPSHVVFACVGFFDCLFTSIEEVASEKAKSKRPIKHTPLLADLSQLASSLIANLQVSAPTCPPHAEIIEGATYHLLHRLGEATHELLLEGPRHEHIEDEINHLPLPEDKRLDPVRQMALRALLTSAPHLLNILRRAVSITPGTALTDKARLRLQRTLVDCIFGPGTRGSQASQDVLRLPEALGNPPVVEDDVKPGSVQDKASWFESELWALIGWEILGSESDL